MKLVRANPEKDCGLIYDMHKVCFPGMELPEMWGDWWIAKDGPTLLGFAGLYPSFRVDGAGYLCRAGVLPQARGRGLQRRMIAVREREARRKNWLMMFTDADPMNTASVNNLVDAGYRLFRPKELWCGSPWIYLRKALSDGVA